jgi:hypothetical protein
MELLAIAWNTAVEPALHCALIRCLPEKILIECVSPRRRSLVSNFSRDVDALPNHKRRDKPADDV